MLKPASTRHPSVLPPVSSGPEWIEPEPVEPGKGLNYDQGFRDREDSPSDFALDLRLHEILEQARLATAANGALVALADGDRMVCRATLGDMAPSVGVWLNTRSGLSGACVQAREMQLCDDTLADPRVNVVACRELGMRSIVALPVLEGGELRGVLEVFSSAPRAFSDFDLQALQALSQNISHSLHEGSTGGSAEPVSEKFTQPLATDASQVEEVEQHTLFEPDQPETTMVRKDYRTGALTVAVLALAVLLGWMVGRVGWSLAVNRAPAQIAISPEEAQATLQGTPDIHAAPPRHEEAVVPAKPVSSNPGPPSRPKTETAEPLGGLVVYEHGKVVFRMAPSGTRSPSKAETEVAGTEAIQKAATRDDDRSAIPTPISPAGSYVLERVEPEYPEAARRQHIQGPVVLNALVGTDGSVRELSVISGDPLLVKAATEAVQRWRFKPHQIKGDGAEFETRITVNFALPE